MTSLRKKNIVESAAALKAAHYLVDKSANSAIGLKNMKYVYAAEVNILAAPLRTVVDILIAREVLYEEGEPDLGNDFEGNLALKILEGLHILEALLPDESGKIAAAA
jgi:hypothetical protein